MDLMRCIAKKINSVMANTIIYKIFDKLCNINWSTTKIICKLKKNGKQEYNIHNCLFELMDGDTLELSHMDCIRIFDTIADCADINIIEREKMYDMLVDKLGLED